MEYVAWARRPYCLTADIPWMSKKPPWPWVSKVLRRNPSIRIITATANITKYDKRMSLRDNPIQEEHQYESTMLYAFLVAFTLLLKVIIVRKQRK